MMSPLKLIVIGAGNRGRAYARYADFFPNDVQIVGVAEPKEKERELFAERYKIPQTSVFRCWQDAAKVPKFADGVIIATHDPLHVEPTEAFAAMGYHILLEKPMAKDTEGCLRILKAIRSAGVVAVLGHILRYTKYTRLVKSVIDSGTLGDLVSVQHIEPVWYWHLAHGFVRGSWRNDAVSSPMLLQKSCHDIDWLRYLIGKSCLRVSSFGSKKHFIPANRPEGAADRCLDCPAHVEAACPYSARRIYYKFLHSDNKGPAEVLVQNPTCFSLEEALRHGIYGRCAYVCDNDVVDHQSVILEYEDNVTVSFTMTGFGSPQGRSTTFHGTRGCMTCDASKVTVYDFLNNTTRHIDLHENDHPVFDLPRVGGNYALMRNFYEAVIANDPSLVVAGLDESLEVCQTIFAAEKSRLSQCVETVFYPFK